MRRAVLASTVAVALVGCAKGSDDPVPTGSTTEVSQAVADDAVLGLCEAIAAMPGNPDAAAAAFLDQAHQPIHVVAGALQEVDPPRAARLLIAKQAVEADLGLGPPSVEHLRTLLDATRAAVEGLDLVAPACPA